MEILGRPAENTGMVWFFERRGAYVRVETRSVPDGFELAIDHPDGTQIVERFADSREMATRQRTLEHAFSEDGWKGPFGRFF